MPSLFKSTPVAVILGAAYCTNTACFTGVAFCTGAGEAQRCHRRDVLHNWGLCGIHRRRWLGEAHRWRGTHVLHQWSWCGPHRRSWRGVSHHWSGRDDRS